MTKLHRILGIDPATVSGWAFAKKPFTDRSFAGTIDLSSDAGNHGKIVSDFFDAVSNLVKNLKPDIIVYERPFVRNIGGARIQFALTGALESIAYRHGIFIHDAHPSTIRKAALGTTKGSKKDVHDAALAAGYIAETQDEADAQWVITAWINRNKDHMEF